MTYYRNQGRAPCSATIPQRMIIDCVNNYPAYLTHNMVVTIGTTTVSSQRGSQSVTKTWP